MLITAVLTEMLVSRLTIGCRYEQPVLDLEIIYVFLWYFRMPGMLKAVMSKGEIQQDNHKTNKHWVKISIFWDEIGARY